jgi:hypothetical protein
VAQPSLAHNGYTTLTHNGAERLRTFDDTGTLDGLMKLPPKLTPVQERYLNEIRSAGERRYNGKAARPLKTLKALGLIELDFDLRPHADAYGNIKSFTEIWIARPVTPWKFLRDT